MGSLSIWHWIVVLVVILLLFGRGKISELMGDMAQGIKAFKKGMAEDTEPSSSRRSPIRAHDRHHPRRRRCERAARMPNRPGLNKRGRRLHI